MPEDAAGSDLERMLEHLEDFALDTQNYQIIQNALEKCHGNIKVPVVEKLLTICVRDLKQEMKNTVNTLNIVAAVLKKNQAGELHETPDLVPSAIAVLHIIKTTAIHNKLEGLKMLCFEILLLYPNDVLINLAVCHSKDIMEMINLYYHQRIPLDVRLQTINIIFKILKILPPDKLSFFVREGVDIWFTKMIPTVMTFMSSDIKNTMPLETLEILTEELITIDYANNQNWQLILQCIYTPQKYPAIMKNLLESGSDLWYRLWIIFIRLLKNQITKSINSVGSPINSMLPVVETAFKMNVKNRCRAFQCWNVLIDNFSTEINDTYVNKRLKLLIIPLASNNAKVEETALSKLNTWWHLIKQFETKIKNYSDMVLLPFLHFCFGKPAVPEKPVFAPGLLTVNTKRQVLQAFANIAGHVNCDCTDNISKLNSKMLSYSLLVDHWKHWTNALTMTIRICVNDNSDSTFQHFKCIWKSVIATIADIFDINVRNNLFTEILTILEVLLQSPQCDKLADLVFTILTNSILDHNEKVQPVFKAGDNNTVNKIIYLIMNPSLDYVYTRYDAKEIIHKITPLTNFFAGEHLDQVTENYLNKAFVKNSSLMLWTALSISLCELKCDPREETLHTLLLLPLKSMNLFTLVESSMTAWISLYKHIKMTLKGSCALDEAIYDALSEDKISNTTNKYFIFLASLALLNNNKITSENEDLICKITEKLDYATHGTDYSFITNDIIFFVDTLTLMLNNITNINNEKLARTTVLIIKNILNISFQRNEKKNDGQVLNFIVPLIVPLNLLFRKEVYSSLKSLIVDELNKLISFLKLSEKYKSSLEIINNMIGQKTNEGDTAVTCYKESNEVNKNEKINDVECHTKFIEPIIKEQSNKSKKRSSEVVDTVVENGEEYVVVKSNWKFNPKTLTDNQKEKLQRTREDIPALYQDLSQSQDEFKRVFTMNSIDSSTSSKSFIAEKEDASSVLKNMLPCNVVLTIIDNIRTEGTTEEISDETSQNSIKPKSVVEKQILDSKSPKSPRVALKDRVFRNVKNLIEKSGLQVDVAGLNSTVNDNIPSTPPIKQQNNNNNIINSAPTEINSDRPSRVKRKPKKFEDLKPFLCKRRRNSVSSKLNINTSSPYETELIQNEANLLNDDVANADKIYDTANDNNLQDNDVNTNINENECEKRDEVSVTLEISQTCFQNNVTEERVNVGDSKKSDGNLYINSSEEHSQAIGNSIELETGNDSDDVNLTNSNLNTEESLPKSSNKKAGKRKSRIEKELAIDMVEGHPFLKLQSEKRLTRKTVVNISPINVRRKSLVEKLNKSKVVGNESQSESKFKVKSKPNRIGNEKKNDSLERLTPSQSQDIIESSQSSSISTLSTLSAKASKKISKKVTPLSQEISKEESKNLQQVFSRSTLNDFEFQNKNMSEQNIDDTELSRNKTVIQDSIGLNYTEEMDTELPGNNRSSEDGTEIRDDDSTIVISDAESDTANADTQILDSAVLLKESTTCNTQLVTDQSTIVSENNCNAGGETPIAATLSLDTKLVTDNSDISKIKDVETDCSPSKDEAQRKKDFMNNTLEISPIKILSPVQEDKISPTSDTSSDFVVITLSSPVQSNGEPFDKSDSPEIFTNDKTSPDKRDQSPPRGEIITNHSSPSLSLKKNRPQVRSGGRAAQMLVLCVPDTLPTIVNQEKSAEPEDIQRSIATNTSARRNLRILYNSANENNDNCDKNEDSEHFLKLKRSLPSADSSPSGPILKRKLTDIIDETTFSPASKRKRVSFHDPPVSTTICVKKYIEPSGIRSPQNSAIKRLERQARASVSMKSTKRLDNIFKLDKVLTKTVKSFMDDDTCINDDDIEMSSLEETPISEVIKTSDLKDVDLIGASLVNCEDPISNIASELSSPDLKLQLMKEFEGTVQTIGDLAKMSESEINRLCIKSPKLEVARKALADYASQIGKLNVEASEKEIMINSKCDRQNTDLLSQRCVIPENKQKEVSNMAIQTQAPSLTLTSTQTDALPICNTATQTTKPEEESTSSVILSCLSERPDFVGNLCKHLDESSKQEIASDLSLTAVTNTLMEKLDSSNKFNTMSALLDQYFKSISSEEESSARLSVIRNYICDKFKAKDLILFCSDILREAYEKPF